MIIYLESLARSSFPKSYKSFLCCILISENRAFWMKLKGKTENETENEADSQFCYLLLNDCFASKEIMKR